MTQRFCNGYRARHASHFSMIHVSPRGRQLARPTCVRPHNARRIASGENKRLQRIMNPLNNESSVGERINTHSGETARLRAFCRALCAAFTRWLSVPRHRSAVPFGFASFSRTRTATPSSISNRRRKLRDYASRSFPAEKLTISRKKREGRGEKEKRRTAVTTAPSLHARRLKVTSG